jgi:para-aminobenzoate synthetase/4-amino-4-deoxychorismate lyase
MKAHPAGEFPLLWFGLYDAPQRFDDLDFISGAYSLAEWTPDIYEDTYRNAIGRVKDHIAAGRTYQVNFTFRLQNQFSGNPEALFVEMVKAQGTGYFAYVDTGRWQISSASPELFFLLEDDLITCKPMKGTVKRGRTFKEDLAQAEWLKASEKNRAENVMIVDMIRNDLGRIAEVGSVQVPVLFEAEQYRTLWQMTSTVTARKKKSFVEIMSSLFPCASITGAPKVSTMNIIAELEASARGLYTGCIGFLSPNGSAQFNVAIRTVTIDSQSGRAQYGVGGGIVWDSTAEDEFDEALLKARVITQKQPAFNLIETLRWNPDGGYYLLDRHLQRLGESARYFRFKFDRETVTAHLTSLTSGFSQTAQRVRIELDPDGKLTSSVIMLEDQEKTLQVSLARKPVHSRDIYLFHKTTHRAMYADAHAGLPGDDVLLYNERGELTEFSIGNLVVEKDGELLTPPVDCGLLAGTFRAELLERGLIRERVLTKDDLAFCTRFFLINSVRGWVNIDLIDTAGIT